MVDLYTIPFLFCYVQLLSNQTLKSLQKEDIYQKNGT